MKVVIKRPGEIMSVIEVSDLEEINKLTGNVDEEGNGYSYSGSDFRCEVFKGIDIHMNGHALFNAALPANFWDLSGNRLYCGNVVFAGYDSKSGEPFGVCSLSDEQISYLMEHIGEVYDIH